MAINSLSSASKGLSGLASGMDTQSMVDAMLSGTQSKIDKAKASKTTLGYKQTMYRDVFSSLQSMQSNFLSFGSNSLRYSGFYNPMSASTKSTAFKVSANSSAAAGNTIVNSITQLAKAAQIKTSANQKVSGVVEGELDLRNLAGQEIQVTLDGVTRTIKLPTAEDIGTGTPTEQAQKFRDTLQQSINRNLGSGIVVGGTGDKQLSLSVTDTSREFMIKGKDSAMQALGLKQGVSNKLNQSMELGDLNLNTKLQGDIYKFSINGEKFEFSSEDSISRVISVVNNSSANVKLRYSSLEDKFIMESTVSGKDVTIDMKQEAGNLLTAMFGVGTGSGAIGTKVDAYGSVEGTVLGYKNLYTPGTPLSADDLAKANEYLKTLTSVMNAETASTDLKMTFTVDGTEVTVTLPQRQHTVPGDTTTPLKEYTLDDVLQTINDTQGLIDKGISVGYQLDENGNKTGNMTLDVPTGTKVGVDGVLQRAFGFGEVNKVSSTGDTKLEDAALGNFNITANVGGRTTNISITADMTMDEIAAKMQAELDPTGTHGIKVEFGGTGNEGRFRIFGVDIPMTLEIGGDGTKLFGTDKLSFNTSDPGMAAQTTVGANAELYINGIKVERNSNEFTIDGISFELKETFNTTDPTTTTGGATVDVTRNTQQVFDGVVKFMEDYNKLVDKAWGMVKSAATYKDYPPLSDKQKAEMSDREVELWEKNSQQGLLRSDPTITSIMDAMRRALISKPDGAKYSLAEMGITVGYDIDKGYGGMLKFSDNDASGAKFKEMITQEPEALEQLFSGADGIMNQVNTIITGATTSDTSMKTPFSNLSLVNLAGRPNMPDTASSIYKQIKDVNDNLEALTRKYKAEYARYWRQFSAMEQSISSMNSQSSWLTQQFQ